MSGSTHGTSSLAVDSAPGIARKAWYDAEQLYVELTDGRVVTHELPGFVRDTPPDQRGPCQVEDFGTAIWWPRLGEGVGLNWVFGVRERVIEELAGFAAGP